MILLLAIQEIMFTQKFPYDSVAVHQILPVKTAMLAAAQRDELIGRARLVQCGVQPRRLVVRHDVVLIPVNREDRRESGADVTDRRKLARKLFTVAHAAEP